jgi:hypothetical protein
MRNSPGLAIPGIAFRLASKTQVDMNSPEHGSARLCAAGYRPRRIVMLVMRSRLRWPLSHGTMSLLKMRLPCGTECLRLVPKLVLLCLSMISFDSCEQLAKPQITEETVQTYPLSAGAKVKVESSCGAISVSGWDREECRVEAITRASGSAELALTTLEVDAPGDRVSIRATAPPGTGSNPNQGPRVDIRMWVPRDAELENIVSGRGDVTITDTDGNVVACSVNGSVLVERVTGDLTLKCVNGRTVARLSTLGIGQRVDLETVNGSTTVVLPVEASVEVSAQVVNGNVISDLGLPIEPDFPAGRKMEGRLGRGGATVSARTANGSVSIWKGR